VSEESVAATPFADKSFDPRLTESLQLSEQADQASAAAWPVRA
jgi:hypothetical protein